VLWSYAKRMIARSDLLNRLFSLPEPPAVAAPLLDYEMTVTKLHRVLMLRKHSTPTNACFDCCHERMVGANTDCLLQSNKKGLFVENRRTKLLERHLLRLLHCCRSHFTSGKVA
jgi:hypothetical protein